MDIEVNSLFSRATSCERGVELGQWQVQKPDNSVVIVSIFRHALLEAHQNNELQTIEFDFDLKFSFCKESNRVQFQRSNQKCCYLLQKNHHLNQWRSLLKSRLNQRGFHEQFKSIRKIGKGNFASVYLAQKIEDQVLYAVKAFSKEAAYSEQNGKECLVKQIELARSLDSKNTMKLHEVFESENSLYIVFELLSGGQLYDKIKAKHEFTSQETRQVVRGVLRGLCEMHSKGIMHRDLKPENLIFRREGQWDCVIADYGLAQFCDAEVYLFARCGTPGYVAPEVINIRDMSSKYSPVCDVYSLGLIFHILLMGKSAFPGKTYNEVLAQNRAANIDLAAKQYSSLPSSTLNLLKKMLNPDPFGRISAKQALNEPYFTEEADQMMDEIEQPQVVEATGSNSLQCQYLTNSNLNHILDKKIKKDSCLEFHMGKENVFTGKTEEVESLKSHKISFWGAQTPQRTGKVSQFVASNK